MFHFLSFSFLAIVFCSCTIGDKKSVSPADSRIEMMDADRAFSQMSAEKGMKFAFMEYIDSNGVLLRPNEFPIAGADAIDYLSQLNDSTYTMTWQPRNGSVSSSGDLGYTYGVYQLKPTEKDTILYGTYVSIWKKQSDGRWKFVLDSGNEGVGEIQGAN